jgi:hypothetical protein
MASRKRDLRLCLGCGEPLDPGQRWCRGTDCPELELARLQEAGARVGVELRDGFTSGLPHGGWRAVGADDDGLLSVVEAGPRRGAVLAAIAMASSAEHWPASAP